MAEHEILGILGLLGFFLKCEVKLWNLDNTDAPSCHTGKVLIKSSKQQCCDSAKMGKLVWWIKSTQKIKHKSGNVCRSKKPFINLMHPTLNGISAVAKPYTVAVANLWTSMENLRKRKYIIIFEIFSLILLFHSFQEVEQGGSPIKTVLGSLAIVNDPLSVGGVR